MSGWENFYKLTSDERITKLAENRQLTVADQKLMRYHFDAVGSQQVENYLYNFGVPVGVITDLLINDHHVTVPMATEEPSVIAAANNGAKLVRYGTGIKTRQTERLVRGQVIVTGLDNPDDLLKYVNEHVADLLNLANNAYPSMKKRGGGAKRILSEVIDHDKVIVNILVDPQAAMGANVVNTMAEAVAQQLRTIGYNVLLAILSNMATEAIIDAQVKIPVGVLATKGGLTGAEVADRIVQASLIEQLSEYRAVTSNKGLMNGIEAAVLASGNDTRSVNAALHAYAAKDGKYRGLVQWSIDDGELVGKTTLPLLLGVVGGSIGIVPAVKLNHTIMGNPDVNELTAIIAGVGLVQNLAALKALVTTGIQSGHMKLQAKSLAVAVGASPSEVPLVVRALQAEKKFNSNSAKRILDEIRK